MNVGIHAVYFPALAAFDHWMELDKFNGTAALIQCGRISMFLLTSQVKLKLLL